MGHHWADIIGLAFGQQRPCTSFWPALAQCKYCRHNIGSMLVLDILVSTILKYYWHFKVSPLLDQPLVITWGQSAKWLWSQLRVQQQLKQRWPFIGMLTWHEYAFLTNNYYKTNIKIILIYSHKVAQCHMHIWFITLLVYHFSKHLVVSRIIMRNRNVSRYWRILDRKLFRRYLRYHEDFDWVTINSFLQCIFQWRKCNST